MICRFFFSAAVHDLRKRIPNDRNRPGGDPLGLHRRQLKPTAAVTGKVCMHMRIVDVPVVKLGFDKESYDGERRPHREDLRIRTYLVSYVVLRCKSLRILFFEDTALVNWCKK